MTAGVHLVTGAASGMGRLMAQRAAGDGVPVVAVDTDADGLAATAAHAPTMRTVVGDVADASAVAELVAAVEADDGPIARVVTAAAIAPTGRLVDQDIATVRRVTEINQLGTVNVVWPAMAAMRARGRGEVVVFASLAGWMPTPRLGAYSATKHALVALCEVLSAELAVDGVRLVCACPPLVDTPMVDQLRAGGLEAAAGARSIAPEVVVEASEAALVRRAGRRRRPAPTSDGAAPATVTDGAAPATATDGPVMVFPGRGTTSMVRARRWMPGPLGRMLQRQVR